MAVRDLSDPAAGFNDPAVYTTIRDMVGMGNLLTAIANEVRSGFDAPNDVLDFLVQDAMLSGLALVQEGTGDTTKLRIAGTDLRYRVAGREYYSKGALETEPPIGEITGGKWGCYRMELNTSGTFTVTRKADPMAYDNAEDALLSLGSFARTAVSIDMGYLVIDAAAGGWTAQTDLPVIGDAQVDTIAWTDAVTDRSQNGLTVAVTVAAADGVATLNVAAVDVDRNGAKLTQIAADTTQAMNDADVITNGNWGGWLLVVFPDGSDTYALASDGVAGSVSTMASASKAAVDTALDLVQDRIPAHCVPIARIYVDKTKGVSDFTAATTNWDGDMAVTTVEVYPVSHDRTSDRTMSVILPAIPATFSAAAADSAKFDDGTPT